LRLENRGKREVRAREKALPQGIISEVCCKKLKNAGKRTAGEENESCGENASF